jgi:glucosyl-3-phosphoglycerate synthase
MRGRLVPMAGTHREGHVPSRPDVQDWFRRRTWHQRDFDRDTVVRQLRATSVAVVIPALDEEETVGEIVGAIRRDLVEAGLVDELVVVDGGSADATARVASEAGADVVHQADAIPGADPLRGKGDSMWKGVGSTTSDLVVFLDADLRSFEPDWVLALVQPMLADQEIAFVKAFYDRPFDPESEGDDDRDPAEDDLAGGGRVTELLARPLLNTWWPELSGVVQPLAGEYAGRRDVFETVPFVAGYGVEIGLLVDIAERRGGNAVAQVDVGLRLHEHQDLAALGRMSAEILRTVAQRKGWEPDLPHVLVQPERDDRGDLVLAGHGVPYVERPPLVAWPVAETP